MRSDLIELHAPGRNHHPRLIQRMKQIANKALSADIPNYFRQRCSVATEIGCCWQNCSWLR